MQANFDFSDLAHGLKSESRERSRETGDNQLQKYLQYAGDDGKDREKET